MTASLVMTAEELEALDAAVLDMVGERRHLRNRGERAIRQQELGDRIRILQGVLDRQRLAYLQGRRP